MKVEILLFARLRELCDQSRTDIEVADGSTVEDCFVALVKRFPGLSGLREGVVVAINEDYASWTDTPEEGDTIAFIPPVSGG
jgi:molybdopterin converting factor subunit 1